MREGASFAGSEPPPLTVQEECENRFGQYAWWQSDVKPKELSDKVLKSLLERVPEESLPLENIRKEILPKGIINILNKTYEENALRCFSEKYRVLVVEDQQKASFVRPTHLQADYLRFIKFIRQAEPDRYPYPFLFHTMCQKLGSKWKEEGMKQSYIGTTKPGSRALKVYLFLNRVDNSPW